ncbi:serine/threonine protein kinase [Microbispora catharanthi]|uniref:Protein kinase n=1 Tax=Microbispora catharanthi TaxID=1712871 RepID=A0A5N6C1N0_9ACTN|nr:serine/threonine-protein kinase [Microbispora catharanthi]KAB8186676.1 protein kinase [Microbispora catharanthi]
MPDISPLRPGDPQRIGQYMLTGRLGTGGQGIVYHATGPTGEPVAVKWIRADLTGDTVTTERFLREVAAAKRVAAFCTAQILDTGMESDRPYIVSEYIDGPSLQQSVASSGPVRGNALYRLAIGVATALAAVHKAGIVHRDLKPPNVLMGPDGVRVIDFGISRALDATSSLTSVPIGTPAYMAPEQFLNKDIGPATDMFAWASTIVFAASGNSPFGSASLPAVINRILNAEPEIRGIDGTLRDLVASCLRKDPAQRPTAQQVIVALLEQYTPDGVVPDGEGPRPETVTGAAEPDAEGPPPPPSETPVWSRSAPGRRPDARTGARPVEAGGGRETEIESAVEPGGRADRHRIKIAAVVAVIAAITAGLLLRSGDREGTGAEAARVVTSLTPPPAAHTPQGGGSTPAAASTPPVTVPRTGLTKTKLPGVAATLYEHPDDPVSVTSFTTDAAEYTYVRDSMSAPFKKKDGYLDYTVSPDGTYGLGIPVYFYKGTSSVDLIELRTGVMHKVKTVRQPKVADFFQWSRDGGKVLLSIRKPSGKDRITTGFIVVDAARRTAKIVEVDDPAIKESVFGWDADEEGVVAFFRSGRTKGLRFFDLSGKAVRDITGPTMFNDIAQFLFSPSGTSFASGCPQDDADLCVWDHATGREKLRIASGCSRFVGWYDERHVVCWENGDGDKNAMVILDMTGGIVRALMQASDEAVDDLIVNLRFRPS